MACSFQDLTGQRTTKVVRVLQYLEERIASMIDIWGISSDSEGSDGDDASEAVAKMTDERPDAHLLNGPQDQDLALGQDNIDALLGHETAAPEVPVPPVVQEDDEDVVEDKASASTSSSMPSGDVSPPKEVIDDLFDNASTEEPIDEEQLKALFN